MDGAPRAARRADGARSSDRVEANSRSCEAVTGISVKKPTALKPSAIEYAPCASRRPAHSACSSVVLRELPLSPHARVRHGMQARAGG